MTKKKRLAKAIARLEAAQAVYDAGIVAAGDNDDALSRLGEAESNACNKLAQMPCANDAEFLEKLKALNCAGNGLQVWIRTLVRSLSPWRDILRTSPPKPRRFA